MDPVSAIIALVALLVAVVAVVRTSNAHDRITSQNYALNQARTRADDALDDAHRAHIRITTLNETVDDNAAISEQNIDLVAHHGGICQDMPNWTCTVHEDGETATDVHHGDNATVAEDAQVEASTSVGAPTDPAPVSVTSGTAQ